MMNQMVISGIVKTWEMRERISCCASEPSHSSSPLMMITGVGRGVERRMKGSRISCCSWMAADFVGRAGLSSMA